MEATREAFLTRPDGWETNPNLDGLFSDYVSDSGFHCRIAEPPWRDNAPNISCTPAGRRLQVWKWSEKHKCNCYHEVDTPGRDVIEWHKGNIAGDAKQGRGSDTEGCRLPGMSVQMFMKGSIHADPPKPPVAQMGVTDSGTALSGLERDMYDPVTKTQLPFWLTVR